jgi:hypothetical protein
MKDTYWKYVMFDPNNTLQIPRVEIGLLSDFDEGQTWMTKMEAAFSCIQHTAYNIQHGAYSISVFILQFSHCPQVM